MSKSEKIRELLQQGKEPVDAAKEAGATPTLAYKLKKELKRKGKKAPKAKAKAAKRSYNRKTAAPETSGSVVWRAKNGGTAVFASKEAAQLYLGKLTAVIPVAVLT